MPSDPRSASGFCESVGYTPTLFAGTFSPWQTGTPSSIPASSSSMYPWLPTSIGNIDVPMSLLPTYTNTATIITLPVPTFTSIPSSVTQGYDGWFDTADSGGGIMTIAGCTYLNEYSATFAVTPTAPCPAGGSVPTVATTTVQATATATSSTGAGVLSSTTSTALTTTATS